MAALRVTKGKHGAFTAISTRRGGEIERPPDPEMLPPSTPIRGRSTSRVTNSKYSNANRDNQTAITTPRGATGTRRGANVGDSPFTRPATVTTPSTPIAARFTSRATASPFSTLRRANMAATSTPSGNVTSGEASRAASMTGNKAKRARISEDRIGYATTADSGPSASLDHDFYEEELQREADMRLEEEDGQSSSDEEEEDEEGQENSDHDEFDKSGDEIELSDADSDDGDGPDSSIDSEDDIPLIELQKGLKEAKRKKKKSKTPPEFELRNDMPNTPASYERNFGAGKNKTKLVWKVKAPDNAQVNACKLDCDSPEKAQLSEEAEDLIGCEDVMAVYKRIIEDGMMQSIIDHTNAYAEAEYKRKRRKNKWKKIDLVEMNAYFGACYYMGEKGLNDRSLDDIWGANGTEVHLPLLEAFGRDRFKAITRYLRMHDRVGDTKENCQDRQRKTKEFLDPLVLNCRNLITPGQVLTVDESLVTYRGRCGWRQYIKSKPGKYGMKFYTECDVSTGALLNVVPYVGKKSDKRATGLCTSVVVELAKPYWGSGRVMVTDRYYSSPTLSRELRKHDLDSVGTLKTDRLGIPKPFAELKLQPVKRKRRSANEDEDDEEDVIEEVASSQNQPSTSKEKPKAKCGFVFSQIREKVDGKQLNFRMAMAKYEPKPGKSTTLISTIHLAPSVAKDEAGKPEAVLFYNDGKPGVDRLDQLVGGYTTKRATRRWPQRVFYWGLDLAAVQAYIVYRLANDTAAEDQHYRRKFMVDLWTALMAPQRERRLAQRTKHVRDIWRLQYALRKFMKKQPADTSKTLSTLKEAIGTPLTKKQIRDLTSTAPAARRRLEYGTKPKRSYAGIKRCYAPECTAIDRKTKVKCQICGEPICPDHRVKSQQGYVCADYVATPCKR